MRYQRAVVLSVIPSPTPRVCTAELQHVSWTTGDLNWTAPQGLVQLAGLPEITRDDI